LASLSQRIIHLLLRKWAPTSFGKRKNVAAFPRLGRIVPKFGNPQFIFRGFPPQYVSKLGAAIGSSKKKPLELERRRRIAEWI
jgi:hypothetical protein